MRLVCISDTHSLHHQMEHPLPKGDVLIHAGDISNKGGEQDVKDFICWINSKSLLIFQLPFQNKIQIWVYQTPSK